MLEEVVVGVRRLFYSKEAVFNWIVEKNVMQWILFIHFLMNLLFFVFFSDPSF